MTIFSVVFGLPFPFCVCIYCRFLVCSSHEVSTWPSILYTHTYIHTHTIILSCLSLMLHLEKVKATHSSTLAWKIPWMEEPGGLQFMGLLRVGHDWVTSLSLFTFMHWRRKWQPTPVFLPGESQGQKSLVGCHLWGSHRVGHDWSNLAAAAAAAYRVIVTIFLNSIYMR